MNDSDHGRVVRIFVCLSRGLYCHWKSKRALEQWWPTARQKRSYLYHQGEFQHNYFDFVSLHHSDHDSLVRISVGHSEIVKRLLHYITRHNLSPTRSVTYVQVSITGSSNSACFTRSAIAPHLPTSAVRCWVTVHAVV